MTPAETLTAAADRIERLATEATPGRFGSAGGLYVYGAVPGDEVAVYRSPHDAAWALLWSPDVALLLVPVLRAEAARAAEVERRGIRLGERLLNADLLAFAQALIGGDQ